MTRDLRDLETPCLVADRRRLVANAQRMLARAREHGFQLRPHLKTAKSADVARIAHGGTEGPITVSTLREAEYFLDEGFDDITYAVALSPNKYAHAADLAERGADLKVLVSSADVASSLAVYASAHSARFRALLEIDSGEHRTGFEPEEEALGRAARILHNCRNIELLGLLTHGGHSYRCKSKEEIAAVAEQERQSLQFAKNRLAVDGIDVSISSSGSTPTATLGRRFKGIDEVRPGVYLAGDLFQAQLGSCTTDDIAFSVLATVIAHDPPRNRMVIDAGGLALSKDRSTQGSPIDYGYGLLTGVDGHALGQALIVRSVHQEHGEVHCADAIEFEKFPIGSQVRVLPNHACMTAAAYDRYYVIDGHGTRVFTTWDKVGGW